MTKIASKTPSVDPRSAVERLNAQELKFALLHGERAAVLAEVRAGRGRAVLAANDPSAVVLTVNSKIRGLEDELAGLNEAASEARRLRLQAIPAVFEADAVEAELAAAKLETEAAELQAESQRLRMALESFDGCAYAPTAPPMRDLSGPRLEGGGAAVYYVRAPQFELRRMSAAGLLAEAVQHRQKRAHRAGALTAGDLTSLLAAVFSDPLRIGPSVDEIYTWSVRGIEKQHRTLARSGGGESLAPTRLHLVWNQAVIDVAQSWIAAESETSEVDAPFDSRVGFEQSEEASA
jgi:hypothetical protein